MVFCDLIVSDDFIKLWKKKILLNKTRPNDIYDINIVFQYSLYVSSDI